MNDGNDGVGDVINNCGCHWSLNVDNVSDSELKCFVYMVYILLISTNLGGRYIIIVFSLHRENGFQNFSKLLSRKYGI
jgi:hypothetical protein